MSTLQPGEGGKELPPPLNTVEAFAHAIKPGLRRAIEVVANPAIHTGIRINFAGQNVQFPPAFQSTRHGVIVGLNGILNQMRVPGMDQDQALEAALDQLLGEPKPLPDDLTGRDIYMVDCHYAFRSPRGNGAARLALDHVQPGPEALTTLAQFYRWIPAAVAEYDAAVARGWWTTDRRFTDSMEHLKAHLPQAAEELQKIESMLAGQSQKPLPPVTWLGGYSDSEAHNQVFSLAQTEEGRNYHWLEVPLQPSRDEGVERNLRDVELAMNEAAKRIFAAAA